MAKVFGILAHVDAGKTTFSEQLLYKTGKTRKLGRVDDGNTVFDTDDIEKRRGITIFSGQSDFEYNNNRYFIIDTPGHMDFAQETERALRVMDYVVILVSAVDGIQGHTEVLLELAMKYKKPICFFINKTDRQEADVYHVVNQLRKRCNVINLQLDLQDGLLTDDVIEAIAETDENLLEAYLNGEHSNEFWIETLKCKIEDTSIYPCFSGSALTGEGIEHFLCMFDMLTVEKYDSNHPICADVYKIGHDANGNRVSYLKITGGVIKPKDMIQIDDDTWEKINDIKICNGSKLTPVQQAKAGDLCLVTGLKNVRTGDTIGCLRSRSETNIFAPFQSKVISDENPKTLLQYFRILEDEEPGLHVVWQEDLKQITINTMGEIQLEILKEEVLKRFGIEVGFGACEVLYKETIKVPVMGYGHFEPLRHYAEVHLLLEPIEEGIVFESKCSLDILPSNVQHLIETHVFEKQHKGVLIGAPLTGIKLSLITGRNHEKHTEGGDFRQAVYRAIRQGVMCAESILLEPIYSYRIRIHTDYIGKIMGSLQLLKVKFDAPITEGNSVEIIGKAPAKSIINYQKDFMSETKGSGMLSYSFSGYEPCADSDNIIRESEYNPENDFENTGDSVFCKKGAGYNVKWYEAKEYMHCL